MSGKKKLRKHNKKLAGISPFEAAASSMMVWDEEDEREDIASGNLRQESKSNATKKSICTSTSN